MRGLEGFDRGHQALPCRLYELGVLCCRTASCVDTPVNPVMLSACSACVDARAWISVCRACNSCKLQPAVYHEYLQSKCITVVEGRCIHPVRLAFRLKQKSPQTIDLR